MRFRYFYAASCNNDAVFAGFSLICLESLGSLLKKKKSNGGGGFELCLVQFSYFLKAFCLCCYNILSIVNCEFKGQLHHLLPQNGNICSENRKVVEYQL